MAGVRVDFLFFYLDSAGVRRLCLEERGVETATLHSLHVSDELHWDSSLVSLPRRLPALSFPSSPEADTHTCRYVTSVSPHSQMLS